MQFLCGQVQHERQEQLHQYAGGGGLPTQRAHGLEQPVREQGNHQTVYGTADERERELAGSPADRELAGDGGGDGELEADDAGCVIEQRLAFEHAQLAQAQRRLLAQRADRHRVGRPQRRAKRQCGGERHGRPDGMDDDADRHHGGDGQSDCQ